MSVVIAIKDKNKIIMGSDSQATSGGLRYTLPQSAGKIAISPQSKHILIGGVGNTRDAQVIQNCKNLIPEINILKDDINFQYVVNELTMNVYNVLRNMNRVCTNNNGIAQIESTFIFAYKDEAWLIGNDLTVIPIEDYLVIGSGVEVANGVLENTKDLDAVTRIKQAIEACNKKTIYIDNNVQILHT